MAETWVRIGTVRSVNPARREARISIISGHAHEFAEKDWLRIVTARGKALRCRLEQLREGGGDTLIAAFVPGVTRDTVGAMRGASVVLNPDETTLPDSEDLRAEHLPGLTVRFENGTELGQVVEVYASPAHPVVCVERREGGRFLLPMIDAVVVAVDLETRVLEVRDIEPYVIEAPA